MKYLFMILFLLGMLAADHSGSVNTANEPSVIRHKTLSAQSANLPDVPPQQRIIERKESQPLTRTGTAPTEIVHTAVLFPPAAVRYVSADETVIRFSIRIFTRYLPRDPTV